MLNFIQNLTTGRICRTNDEIISEAENAEIIKTSKKIEYFNIPCAFDIETTSFYENGEKRAIMYVWTFGINGAVIIGRTWEEFLILCEKLVSVLGLNPNKRLVCYIQNLSFEFQFFRKWFEWLNVFASKERQPIYATSLNGIEFRCSYLLSGYSLETIGKNLTTYKVNKLVGDLDYSLERHSLTPITEKELGYMIHDVLVVMAYIQEKIERDGDITRIQLTKTGYVRKLCRDACLYEGNHKKNGWKYLEYRQLMNALILTPEEYQMAKRAFAGGFTHANAWYSGETCYNVFSWDFCSAYPAVMVMEKFPMSRGKRVVVTSMKDFREYIRLYCCLFSIRFIGIESISVNEHPISFSHCRNVENETVDNGRIVRADALDTVITDIDFSIFEKFYKWDRIEIGTFYIYRRGYLPRNFVKAILKLYANKTELKDVEGSEIEYLNSKEMLNSAFGMCCTDVVRAMQIYENGEWTTETPNLEKALEKENKSPKRFLFFLWGVWVTAYCRRNLFTGIYELGTDYIYSDTDSVKGMNEEKHLKYFEAYNDNVKRKLEKAMKFQDIDISLTRPKTKEGKEKIIGIWEREGTYSRFRSVGAKRYLTEKDGKISLTVSGVNKHTAVPYLLEKYGRDGIFEHFTDELIIPKRNDLKTQILDENGLEITNPTGKNIHTYIDDEISGYLIDYTGIEAYYYEKSSVHIEPAEYTLSLSDIYVNYLKGIREIE